MHKAELVERVARAMRRDVEGGDMWDAGDEDLNNCWRDSARAALREIVAAAGGADEKGPRRALLRGAAVIEAYDHGCEPSSGDTAALLRALAEVGE